MRAVVTAVLLTFALINLFAQEPEFGKKSPNGRFELVIEPDHASGERVTHSFFIIDSYSLDTLYLGTRIIAEGPIRNWAWSSEGPYMIFEGGSDREQIQIQVWDLNQKKVIRQIDGSIPVNRSCFENYWNDYRGILMYYQQEDTGAEPHISLWSLSIKTGKKRLLKIFPQISLTEEIPCIQRSDLYIEVAGEKLNYEILPYHKGDSLRVNAIRGLNVRKHSGSKGEKLGKLSYGKAVRVLGDYPTDTLLNIGGMSGNWVEIETDSLKGFVFDAYLTHLPTPIFQKPTSEFCYEELLRGYIFGELEVVNWITYKNLTDGEGSTHKRIYDLGGGHQYVDVSVYESWEHQLHLQHTRDSEGIQLVKNILEVCGVPTQKLGDISFLEHPHAYIEVDEFCCDISFQKYGRWGSDEPLIIGISGGI